jgi:hypothetical protein
MKNFSSSHWFTQKLWPPAYEGELVQRSEQELAGVVEAGEEAAEGGHHHHRTQFDCRTNGGGEYNRRDPYQCFGSGSSIMVNAGDPDPALW